MVFTITIRSVFKVFQYHILSAIRLKKNIKKELYLFFWYFKEILMPIHITALNCTQLDGIKAFLKAVFLNSKYNLINPK